MIENAGFSNVEFSEQRYDTFSDAPSASSAAAFGTQGVNITAVKLAETRSVPVRNDTQVACEWTPGNGASQGPVELPAADDVFDAGTLGCGDGPLLDISKRLKAMPPGSVLEIRSTDPGVAADLPAWCRMVGHEYLGAGTGEQAGRFSVRRKQD